MIAGLGFANAFGFQGLDVCLDYGDLVGIGEVTGSGWDFNQRNMAGDYRFAKTLLIWDTNPPNSQPHSWHFCMEAKDAGANLVVIDPTYTIAAQQATKWVPIKPGTDPALGMAMLNAIIANEWYDLDFMREKTCAPLLVREDNRPSSARRISARRARHSCRVPVLRHTATPGREGRQGAHVGGVGPLCGMGRRQGRLGPHQ